MTGRGMNFSDYFVGGKIDRADCVPSRGSFLSFELENRFAEKIKALFLLGVATELSEIQDAVGRE